MGRFSSTMARFNSGAEVGAAEGPGVGFERALEAARDGGGDFGRAGGGIGAVGAAGEDKTGDLHGDYAEAADFASFLEHCEAFEDLRVGEEFDRGGGTLGHTRISRWSVPSRDSVESTLSQMMRLSFLLRSILRPYSASITFAI